MISDLQVLLIGGPPGAGKTTLGRALGARLGFGSLTVDDLAITGRVLTTLESHPALHQMRGIGHTRYFTETPGAQLIADAEALEETMWPALDRVIASHVMAKTPTVLDWWLSSPQRVATIDEANVASIWLHVDPEVLEERERRLNAEFWRESADPEQMLANFMERGGATSSSSPRPRSSQCRCSIRGPRDHRRPRRNRPRVHPRAVRTAVSAPCAAAIVHRFLRNLHGTMTVEAVEWDDNGPEHPRHGQP